MVVIVPWPEKGKFSFSLLFSCKVLQTAKGLCFHEAVSESSQNHRMADSGGTSGSHPIQDPWLMQGYLETVAQDHVQTAFEYLQGWRLHNLSRQPMQCSVTLTVKTCFLIFKVNFPCFNFYVLYIYIAAPP